MARRSLCCAIRGETSIRACGFRVRSLLAVALGLNITQAVTARDGVVIHPPITIRFMLVSQSDLCGSPYDTDQVHCGLLTSDVVETLEHTHLQSAAYQLQQDRSVPIKLEPAFQAALIAAIDAGDYAVVVEVDWGITVVAVVDMVRMSESLPNWSATRKVFRRHRRWFTHQNAVAFEPSRPVHWQITLNGSVSFWFYIVGA
jgi:hypothetical protein